MQKGIFYNFYKINCSFFSHPFQEANKSWYLGGATSCIQEINVYLRKMTNHFGKEVKPLFACLVTYYNSSHIVWSFILLFPHLPFLLGLFFPAIISIVSSRIIQEKRSFLYSIVNSGTNFGLALNFMITLLVICNMKVTCHNYFVT